MKSTTETSGEAVEYHIKVPYCKDCKWWGRAMDNPLFHLCEKETHSSPGDPSSFVASYYDNEYLAECDANFSTGPDFGCIHWEKKDGGREDE